MKQAHFLASFLLSILFLFLEFSFRQAPPSFHISRQASLGLWALAPLNGQTPPSCMGLSPGSGGGHSLAKNGMTAGRASPFPQEQRESQRKQQTFFFTPLGELITGWQPTAQVSAWDQPPHTPRQAIQPLLGRGINWGCGEGTRGKTLPTSSAQDP